ncbi:MAG: hypothetical protein H7A51_09015 [Akkermansiaceae bacterium]|nr:hypothetical protein [Akkermansiaceae bacterium]
MNHSTFILGLGLTLALIHSASAETARPKTIFTENFESAGWWKSWKLKKSPRNCSLVSQAHHGKQALRIRIEKGGHLGSSLDYTFKKTLGKEPEKIYFRYYLYLGENWNYTGKMPGFGGTYNKAGWGGRPSDGTKGWSARGSGHSVGNRFQMSSYCYHADMKGQYGDSWKWSGPLLEKGRWYCIEQYCQMNTPGKKDGILRAWVDGKQVFAKSDIRMRHNPSLKIEKIWFNIYYGGKATAPTECFIYLDDIAISNQYIGPKKEH